MRNIREYASIVILFVFTILNTAFFSLDKVFIFTNLLTIIILYLLNDVITFSLFLINKKVLKDKYLAIILNIITPLIILIVILLNTTTNVFTILLIIVLELVYLSEIFVVHSKITSYKIELREVKILSFFRWIVLALLYLSLTIGNMTLITVISLVLIFYVTFLANKIIYLARK